MNSPLVSVVIPAYQAEKFVGAAIASALTQTYPHVEIVVADDGSTDRTASVLAGHGDLIRVVSGPNQGVSAARNAAIREARGELIALLDADDILLPAHVETAVDLWQSSGGGRRMVSCEALLLTPAGINPGRTVHPAGSPAPAQQRERILATNLVSIFALFPRTMWEELGGFDEAMSYCEDYDFWARAIFGGYEVVFSEHPTGLYRRSGGSASTQLARMWAGDQLVLEHLRDEFATSMSTAERALLERRLAGPSPHQAIHDGEAALRAGDRETAAAHFRTASALLPADRSIRLKALLLTRVPAAARLYGRRLAVSDHETGRTTSSPDA